MKKIISVLLACILCGGIFTGCEKVGMTMTSGGSSTNIAKSSDEVTPEFKTTMDGYEEFYNKYVDFMDVYYSTSDPSAMMPEFSEMMKKYKDVATNMRTIDPSKLSDADNLYYVEVTARINKKLMELVK